MIYSKHNIFSKSKGSENYFIVNLLSGSADILNPEEGKMLQDFHNGKELAPDFRDNLTAQAYFVDEKEEDRLYRSKYLDFTDARADDEVQLFFVTNYSCNFACTYCYQDEYSNKNLELSSEVIDAFFAYIYTSSKYRKNMNYELIDFQSPISQMPWQLCSNPR